jgi:hypothetical protein
MKTISDFKRKMVKDVIVNTKLYHTDKDGNLQLVREYGPRKVTIVQSNSFALETMQPGKDKPVNSWCEWPKKNEFNPIDENTAEIIFGWGKLIYTFQ